MEPTIRAGEHIQVDESAYRSANPARWDVVAFEPPRNPGQIWLSRIVGLPGETIDITSSGVSIDGRIITLPPSLTIGTYLPPSTVLPVGTPPAATFPYRVPADSYFVLGDNVSNSLDSRYWGGLEKSKIHGKVLGK